MSNFPNDSNYYPNDTDQAANPTTAYDESASPTAAYAEPAAPTTAYGAPMSYGGAAGQPVGNGQYFQPAPAAPTNTLAIVSLITGILGFFTFVTGVAGIICGHMARKQIKLTGEGGDQMALWGMITGYVSVGLWALGILAYIAFIVLYLGFFAVLMGSSSGM